MIGSTNVRALHLRSTRALEDLTSAIPYLTENDVQRMTIRHRPSIDLDVDMQHEHFEKCITRLLAEAPVAISFDYLPNFKDYDGKGIFIPTSLDCLRRKYERFQRRCVLLMGVGVEIHGGKAIEFWEVQGNYGVGFIRLARHMRLISHVFEVEV